MVEGLDDIVEDNESEDDCANSCDEEKDDLDLEDVRAFLPEEAFEIDGFLNDEEHSDGSTKEVETNANFDDGSDDDDDPIWRQAD